MRPTRVIAINVDPPEDGDGMCNVEIRAEMHIDLVREMIRTFFPEAEQSATVPVIPPRRLPR